jgi:omega-hydroxy-beta-dihydromenaquinone-9 sulfotransferase
MDIYKPIFIIGTGRCGSTIFQEIYAYHPQVAWLSWLTELYPKNPGINGWFMHGIDVPIIGDFLIKRIRPGEPYGFWEYNCKGFTRPFRDLTENDVTDNVKSNINKALKRMLTKNRSRLIMKITGWPRIRYLSEIFPDAKFIHILRDGRAVANSLINVDFWNGWGGPYAWDWGILNEEQTKKWEYYNKSFIILAAMEWEILVNAVENLKKNCKHSQFLEIKYENLMSNPVNIFKEVIDFSELEWSNAFQQRIEKFKLKDMNYKWKENLTQMQKNMLNEYLQDYLKKYDYL